MEVVRDPSAFCPFQNLSPGLSNSWLTFFMTGARYSVGGRSARCGAHLESPAATDAKGVQPADARHGLATNTVHSRG
jgi:hypothetical protein